jgi:hypothetical protein
MRGKQVFKKNHPMIFLNIKSDDRSPEAFKQNIESVTQIKGNVSDKNFKPNLLVIDEIDGASQVKQNIEFF